MRRRVETNKYDWTPERWVTVIRGKQSFLKLIPYGRWEYLIYQGRIPDSIDPGCHVSALEGLYWAKKLAGQALEDAKAKFGVIHRASLKTS